MFTAEINLPTFWGYLLWAVIILFVLYHMLGAGKMLWHCCGLAAAAFVGALIGYHIGNIELCIVLALAVYAIFAIRCIRSRLFGSWKSGLITIAVILVLLLLLWIF